MRAGGVHQEPVRKLLVPLLSRAQLELSVRPGQTSWGDERRGFGWPSGGWCGVPRLEACTSRRDNRPA